MSAQRNLASLLLILGTSLLAQPPDGAQPPTSNFIAATHDISQVDPAPLGGVIAVPLPGKQSRRMRKYDLPELVGARQALGSQLINGDLPKPMIDYLVTVGQVHQRLTIFRGGLVILKMSGAGGSMRKRVILPPDALAAYRKSSSPEVLASLRAQDVTNPLPERRAQLRVYRDDGDHHELSFDPKGVLPKKLIDETQPLEDLVRALSEDRTVTNTVAGYEPAVGDELVGDDRRLWRVERIIAAAGIVQLRCSSQPVVIYVDKKFLYNYFIGKKAETP